MKLTIHRVATFTATLCIITFLLSTLSVEIFGSLESVAKIKSMIVSPGLFILIPAMVIAGATGFSLSKGRKGKLVEAKKKRMPIIALNGLIVLVPAAITLNNWAAVGSFDQVFYSVQVLEVIAGTVNATLMIKSILDGRKLTRR
jgi:hypothetical protein